MEIGKDYLFVSDMETPNERYFKGTYISVMDGVYTIFTEGKNVEIDQDDLLLCGEDESEMIYPLGSEEQVALQKNPHKMEMILLFAIESKIDAIAEYISDQCDLTFMYHYKQGVGTAIEIALDNRTDFIVRLLLERNAAFSQKSFLKLAIRKYPLHMFNVSKVKDLSQLFLQHRFREEDDISQWDVSNVENMSDMFHESDFDGDISQWDVSNVKNMMRMFYASEFNGDISQWDVSSVEYMSGMFYMSEFNGDISQWDVSRVKNMSGMFSGSIFQGDLSQWDVSSVKNMNSMFESSIFQGDISQWNVSSVFFMHKMFYDSDFDGDLYDWDVSNVKDMRNMFENSSFQHDISSWNSFGKKMEHMFTNCQIPEYFKPTYHPLGLRSNIGAGKVF